MCIRDRVHTCRVRAAGGKVGGVFVVHQFKAFFGLLSVRFSRGDGDFLAVLFQIHNGDFELIEDPDDLLELLGCCLLYTSVPDERLAGAYEETSAAHRSWIKTTLALAERCV